MQKGLKSILQKHQREQLKPTLRGKQQWGITMIELLATMVVMVTVIGLAAPPFFTLIDKKARDDVASNFRQTLALARSEALKRGATVVLCPINGGGDSCKDGDAGFKNGWVVALAGGDQSKILENAMKSENLIARQATLRERVTFTSNDSGPVIFDNLGRSPTAASKVAGNQTETGIVYNICVSGINRISVTVRPSGRIRMTEGALCS